MERQTKPFEEHITKTAEELASATSAKARETAREVGNYIDSTTETIQSKLRQTGKDVGEVVTAVSDHVKSSTDYLQQQGVSGLIDDVEELIRRYPLHTFLLGIGVGFLLSRRRAE